MNKLARVAAIIIIIVSIGSLFFAFTLAGKKKEHLARIAQLNGSLTQAKSDLTKTQGTLKRTQTDLTKATNDLAQTTAALVATNAALDQKTQEATALQTQLTDAKNQLTQTGADLAKAQATVKNIQSALTDVGYTNISDLAELHNRIVSMGEENKVLGQQLAVMHSENEKLQARVEELSTTPAGLRGHVSVVQSKWGFVVMDIGSSQRVQPKSEFLVYRDSKFVAKVQVISVSAKDCIAQILPQYMKTPPQPGDLVVH
jgi:septal ring factor EnvC (AmiA/AmiB activator)